MKVQTNLLRELEREFLAKDEKKHSWKWAFLILLLGIVMGAGLLSLYFYLQDFPVASRLLGLGIKVETIMVKGEALTEIIGANGKTEPATTIEIKASVGGKVLLVPVEVGAVVSKDRVLAQIDPASYKAVLKEAQEKFVKAKKNFERSELFEKRMNELFARELISSTELEKATREQNTARAYFSETAERFLIAQDNLDKTVITSKVPGIIMERKAGPGETVNPKDTLFLLGITDLVRVAVSLPKEKGDPLTVGQEADIVLDSSPNTIFTGDIEKIDPIAESIVDGQMPHAGGAQQVKVFIRIKSELKIKTGLPAYVWIKNHRKGFMIPRFSVITPPTGQASVFVVQASRARLRPIRIGATRKNKVEVLEGLTEGEEVVSVGLSELQDNDRVVLKGLSK
jgi:membrane fusion protein (multidrug efflux system)